MSKLKTEKYAEIMGLIERHFSMGHEDWQRLTKEMSEDFARIDKVLAIIKYIDPLDESTFMKNPGLYRDPNGRWGITTEVEAMGVTVSGLDGTGSSWWHFDSGEGIGGVPCFIEFDDLIQAILGGEPALAKGEEHQEDPPTRSIRTERSIRGEG